MSTRLHSFFPSAACRLALAVSLAAGAWVTPAQAGTITGQFVNDDDLAVEWINVAGPFHLAARTRSWTAGGFAPVLSLFDWGSGLLLTTDTGSGHDCADPTAGVPDLETGFCWDASVHTTLPGGKYSLVISQDGNVPVGDMLPGQTLADLFSRTGQPTYTGLDYLGVPLRFISVDGTQRGAFWTLDYGIESLQQVPEPATWSLALMAMALLGVKRPRRPHPHQ